jgi:hypothetical protein
MVSGGNGSSDASAAGTEGVVVGTPVAVPTAGAENTAKGVEDGATGRDGSGAGAEGRTGAGLVCRTGASPMPPAPLGASIAAERVAGVASCHPIVTAIGRPSATSPKKMDLGDNRT